MATVNAGLGLSSPVASGGVAHVLNTTGAYSAGTLLAIQNNGADKVTVDHAGNVDATNLRVLATAQADSPNLAAGHSGNDVAADVYGSTVAGGGRSNYENIVGGTDTSTVNTATPNAVGVGSAANLSTITGGYDNMACGEASVISGFHNYTNTTATHGTIGGGSVQAIKNGNYHTIAGGTTNEIDTAGGGNRCTISGGGQNSIVGSAVANATIAGGTSHSITGNRATISGGYDNTASALNATIGGGEGHNASQTATTISGGATNTASAIYASIGGGLSNTASGNYSSIPGGRSCTASGAFSHATGEFNTASGEASHVSGSRAVASLYGQHAQASGRFAADGDAQVSRFVLRRSTTNATPTELRLEGGSVQLVIADDTTWHFKVRVVARRTDADNESAAYTLEGCIDRNSGAASTALVGSVTKVVVAEDTAAWDVSATADTSAGALSIKATGEVAKTIYWVALVEVVQVTG